jgi:hypothetical protein
MLKNEEDYVNCRLAIIVKYKKGKRGRLVYNKIFSLKQMLSFLNHAIERIFQVETNVYIPTISS